MTVNTETTGTTSATAATSTVATASTRATERDRAWEWEWDQWRPPLLPLAWQRMRLELRAFSRVREEVIFTAALPVLLLALFGAIFGGEIENTGVDISQYFVAGMLASTGITVGFQSLSGQLALEQDDGTLKRLAGTPMPKSAYVMGKIGLVVVVAVLQTTVMLSAGVVLFNVSLPDASGWLLLVTVLFLNLSIWTLLGLAFSRIITNPRAGAAVATPPVLLLQFISGVYIYFDAVPSWLQSVASIFPLRWVALGLRQALLPHDFQAAEPGGSWQTGMMFSMLGLWLLAAGVLAGLLFRWRVRE